MCPFQSLIANPAINNEENRKSEYSRNEKMKQIILSNETNGVKTTMHE
jgi:hypothetical protein